MNTFLAFILGVVILALYWVPSIIAGMRHVPNFGSVAVINGLLGWTLVGWAVSLAMAVRDKPAPSAPYAAPPNPPYPTSPVPPAAPPLSPGDYTRRDDA